MPAATVLVVEDDADVCEAIAESLFDAGYVVLTARNGLEALDRLRAAPELPTVVLLDLMMPGMDGKAFLDEIRGDTRLAALRVVLLTADGSAGEKAVSLGATGGLHKPIELDQLLAAVAHYCER